MVGKVSSLLLLAASAALLFLVVAPAGGECAGTPATKTPWVKLAQYLARLPERENAGTNFHLNLAPLSKAKVENDFLVPWLEAVRALRVKYTSGVPEPEKRPKAVVVGGGPLGFLTALSLAKDDYATYQVTLLEKSDGKEDRWNAILAQTDLKAFVNDDLKLDFSSEINPRADWVGSLEEFAVVMGATLELVGIDVRYNTMFVQACTDEKNGGQTKVIVLPTPDHKNKARHHVFRNKEVCSNEAELPNGVSLDGKMEIADVKLLIGADGTYSAVRRGVLADDNWSVAGQSDASFPALETVDVNFVKNPTQQLQLHLQKGGGVDPTPLLTHVIVAFDLDYYDVVKEKTPKDPNAQLEPYSDPVKRPLDKAALSAPYQANPTQRAVQLANQFSKMFDQGKAVVPSMLVPKKYDRDLPAILMADYKDPGALVEADYARVVATAIPHMVPYVDKFGRLRARAYTELLLRRSASAEFRRIFGDVLSTAHTLFNVAKGKLVLEGTDNKEKGTLADQLLDLLYALATFKGDRSLVQTKDEFRGMLDHIKIFNQQVRGAKRTAVFREGGFRAVIVGDATRDSYYMYGNSVNSAFSAWIAHKKGLLAAKDKEAFAEESKKYHDLVVTKFTNFIGTDIILRCACGCMSRKGGNPASANALEYFNVQCAWPNGAETATFEKVPRTVDGLTTKKGVTPSVFPKKLQRMPQTVTGGVLRGQRSVPEKVEPKKCKFVRAYRFPEEIGDYCGASIEDFKGLLDAVCDPL